MAKTTSPQRRARRDPVKLEEVRAKKAQAADLPRLVDANGNPVSTGIDYDRESRKHFKSVLSAAAMNRGIHELIANGGLPEGYSGIYVASNDDAVYVANVRDGWVEGVIAFSHGNAMGVTNLILRESQARLVGRVESAAGVNEGDDDEDFDLLDEDEEDEDE